MRHTSDGMKIDYLAIAILRHADQIVMVQQLTPNDHQPYWVLPGDLEPIRKLFLRLFWAYNAT